MVGTHPFCSWLSKEEMFSGDYNYVLKKNNKFYSVLVCVCVFFVLECMCVLCLYVRVCVLCFRVCMCVPLLTGLSAVLNVACKKGNKCFLSSISFSGD